MYDETKYQKLSSNNNFVLNVRFFKNENVETNSDELRLLSHGEQIQILYNKFRNQISFKHLSKFICISDDN